MTDVLADTGRNFLANVRTARRWPGFLTAVGLLAVFVLASRSIIRGRLAVYGQFVRFPASSWTYLHDYLSAWLPHGTGRIGAAPTGVGLAAALGMLSFGHMGLARTLIVLLPLLLGPVGVWHLLRRATSLRGQAVGTAVYVLVPVAGSAMATGRLGGVLAYGVLPYVLHWLLRSGGAEPFSGPGDPPLSPIVSGLRIAFVASLAVAFAPVVLLSVLALVVAMIAGQVGSLERVRRTAIAGVVGLVGIVVLQLPWSASRTGFWGAMSSLAEPGRRTWRAVELLRFDVGSRHPGTLGWFVLGGLIAAVLVGKQWRFAWAARFLGLYVVSVALAWAVGARHHLVTTNEIEVLLVPALLAVALGAGLTIATFEQDLHGQRLSWRQPVAFLAGFAVILGLIPGVRVLADGRWSSPARDEAGPLRLTGVLKDNDHARVLWLGDPASLPNAGWELAPGFGFSLTTGFEPRLGEIWTSPVSRAERVIAEAVDAAGANSTHRLGQLLGPSAVQYVVVRHRRSDGTEMVDPVGLLEVLRRQLDLRELILGDDSLHVFENQAWIPLTAQLTGGSVEASRNEGTAMLISSDLSGASPVLEVSSATDSSGPVEAGEIFVASADSANWQLSVDGVPATRHPAFGWANSFTVRAPGAATLRFDTPASRRIWVLVQAGLWFGCLAVATGWRLGRFLRRRPRTTAVVEQPLGPAITFDTVQTDLQPMLVSSALAAAPTAEATELTEAAVAMPGEIEVSSALYNDPVAAPVAVSEDEPPSVEDLDFPVQWASDRFDEDDK